MCVYPARTYEPRRSDQTILHRCVSQFWPQVSDTCEAHGRPLPSFVHREFDALNLNIHFHALVLDGVYMLDAQVRVSAHNRLHRERLCRYLLRPPLAKGRLHETMDGKLPLS